jgi:poly(3-hydroxybutyrate) depolymerase
LGLLGFVLACGASGAGGVDAVDDAVDVAVDAAVEATGNPTDIMDVAVPAGYDPATPIPLVMLLHGTADADIGFEGGSIMGFDYLSADDLVDLWVANDGCAELSVTDPTPVDYDLQVAGAETTLTSSRRLRQGALSRLSSMR